MNKQIWKYTLGRAQESIEMPADAEILSAHSQNDLICIWALVNPDAEKEHRYFEVFKTGHAVPCDMGVSREFIGTVLLQNDALVFHIFERIN